MKMVINNLKRLLLSGILLTLISVTSTACYITISNDNFIAFTPVTRSFEHYASDGMSEDEYEEDETGNIDVYFTFYCDKYCFINNPSQIKSVELRSDDTVIPVGLNSIDIKKEPISKIDGRDIFIGNINLTFYNPDQEFLDTMICFTYQDNEEIELPIGNFSFSTKSHTGDENGPLSAEQSIALLGSRNIDGYDSSSVTGLIIKMDAAKKLKIKDLDFGISTVGLNASKVKVYSASEYKSQISPLLDKRGNLSEIEGEYDIPVVNKVSTSCDIDIPKGESYIYVPLTETKKRSPAIMQLVVKATYEADGKKTSLVIPSTYIFHEVSHVDDEIADFFKLRGW